MNTITGRAGSAIFDYAAEAFPPVSGWQWRFHYGPETLPAATNSDRVPTRFLCGSRGGLLALMTGAGFDKVRSTHFNPAQTHLPLRQIGRRCVAFPRLAASAFFAAFLALSMPAQGHSFYSLLCCSEKDCAPLPDGDVVATADGWLIKSTGQTVRYADKRIKISPDGRFRGCFRLGKPDAGLLCLYVPDSGS